MSHADYANYADCCIAEGSQLAIRRSTSVARALSEIRTVLCLIISNALFAFFARFA